LAVVVSTHSSAFPRLIFSCWRWLMACKWAAQSVLCVYVDWAIIFTTKSLEFMLVGYTFFHMSPMFRPCWRTICLIFSTQISGVQFLPLHIFLLVYCWANDDEKFNDYMVPPKKFSGTSKYQFRYISSISYDCNLEYKAQAWESGTDDMGYDSKFRSRSQTPRCRAGSQNQHSYSGDSLISAVTTASISASW
jgi:hypothetical protein